MEKKTYIQPTQRVIALKPRKMLMESMHSFSNNIGLQYGGSDASFVEDEPEAR